MGFHINIHEIEQFWRVSLEQFKFSVNLLFLKSGKMDRKIDINGKPAEEEEWRSQVRRNGESGTTTTTSLWLQYAACSWLLYVLLQCFFSLKSKKKIFHTFDQNLRCAWRNKKFVNRKKSLKIALKSLAKYAGMLYYKSTNK